jgi:hypothetical protein
MGEGTGVKALRAGATVEPVGRRSEADSCTERRYVVSELHGFLLPARGTNERPGMSVHVIDQLVNYRVVATWRTEDYAGSSFGSRTGKDAALREFARVLCERLNIEHEAALS